MKIVLLPSTPPMETPAQHLTTFVINGTLAIDAGSLGFMLPLKEQQHIRHIVLTHTHIDHIASLPIFLENVYGSGPDESVTIHGSQETLDVLNRDVFNERLYPETERLNRLNPPFVLFEELSPHHPVTLEGIRITPFEVDHPVPTLAVRLESDSAGVALITDTGPTDQIQSIVRDTPNLRAVFLEVAFPNEMAWLAEASKHLTPTQFLAEVRQFPPQVPVYAIHVKPRYAEQIATELRAGGLEQVQLVEPGKVYTI